MNRVLFSSLLALALPIHVGAMTPVQYAASRASIAVEAPKSSPSAAKKKGKKSSKSSSKAVTTAAPKSAATSAAKGAPKGAPKGARVSGPVGSEALDAQFRSVLGRMANSGKWGVMVVSLTSGDTLFNHHGDDQLLPASTMKLFTSAMALDRFGTNGHFETEVLRLGAIGTDGILRGDLILRGAGDPMLAGKATDEAGEPPMEALARRISEAGIRRVSGTVIADASAFEDRRIPDGWKKNYLQAGYAARVSALSFNENKITMIVRPEGDHASVSFNPAVSGLPLSNEVRIEKGTRASRISFKQDSTGTMIVRGTMGSLAAPRDLYFVVERPDLFAAGALRAALVSRGITVDGATVRSGRAAIDAPRITAVASPSLEKIVTQMNGESNNHFAELLFRNVAHGAGNAGTAENANALLGRFLTDKARVAPQSVFAADGSGLSTLDRVTPRAMVQLLSYARKTPWGPVFEASLPVAGRTETLRKRMKWTPAMGNLHAKTGTTNDVASLGGYVTTKSGEQLAFSFIYNGRDRWRAKDSMDQMGVALASFSR
jgi:D-alanyl-D-alanine carboxypeptidase/D-alanyl-D-alanine-endopeptidase (penicillin-binding protein 4)